MLVDQALLHGLPCLRRAGLLAQQPIEGRGNAIQTGHEHMGVRLLQQSPNLCDMRFEPVRTGRQRVFGQRLERLEGASVVIVGKIGFLVVGIAP